MLKKLKRKFQRFFFDYVDLEFGVRDPDDKLRLDQFFIPEEFVPQIIEEYRQQGIQILNFRKEGLEYRIPINPQVTSRITAEVANIIHTDLREKVFNSHAAQKIGSWIQEYYERDHVINEDNAGFSYSKVRNLLESKIRRDENLSHYFGQAGNHYRITCDETNNNLYYAREVESAVIHIKFEFELFEEYNAADDDEDSPLSIEGVRINHVFKIEVEISAKGSILIHENEQDLSPRRNSEYYPDRSDFCYTIQKDYQKEISWKK
jgi:hypothetical protein